MATDRKSAKQNAQDRVYDDFEFEVVTDPEAEAEKVRKLNEQIDAAAAQES